MRLLSRTAVLMTVISTITLFTSFRPKTQKVIFFGDSITAYGVKPGENPVATL
jgi:hypothetical protein